MHDLNQIHIFVNVVEQQGIRAAAEKLGVAKSSVSRSMVALETRLGVRLFERSTRFFRITDEGRSYHAHCRRALDELEQADNAVQARRDDMEGTLHISAAVLLGRYLLGDVLPEFQQRHPRARFAVEVSDRVVDLVPEGIDLALRLGTPAEDSGLVSRLLARPSAALYASPGYLQAHGRPTTPQALTEHRTLHMGPPGRARPWVLQRGAQVERLHLTPHLFANDMPTLLRSAVVGTGICMVPQFVCREERLRETLQQVLPDWQTGSIDVRLMVASHRSVTPLLRALIDLLAERSPHLLSDPAADEAISPTNRASTATRITG